MPYRYLEGIALADVAIEAWGRSRSRLFAAAAEALLRTMVATPERLAPRRSVEIHLEEEELDLLLFAFLNELVYYKDARQLLLRVQRLQVAGRAGRLRLVATLAGEEIDPARQPLLADVKAATLHGLQVVRRGGMWRATVVFDV